MGMGLAFAGIMHAEGVLFGSWETGKQYHPRRRRAGWFSVICAGGASLVSEGRSGSIRGAQYVRACDANVGSNLG